jgi:aminoglycoside phosphotransferase (APT) family kinase protein
MPLPDVAGDASAALVELGEQLRAVHEVNTDGHGLIGGSGVPGVGMFSSASDAMRMFMEFGLSGLEHNNWIDGDSARRVRSLFDAHSEALNASPPCLLHGDLKAEHVLVDPETGRLAGVLDPHPWSGEPAYDLARLIATGGEEMRAPLLSGYGAPSAYVNERWQLHEISFLLAITFGHHINGGDAGANASTWNRRLAAALQKLTDSL